jgi:hypothetical protein
LLPSRHAVQPLVCWNRDLPSNNCQRDRLRPRTFVLQVHTGDHHESCNKLDIRAAPFFRLYARGEIVSEFSCNISTISRLKAGLAMLQLPGEHRVGSEVGMDNDTCDVSGDEINCMVRKGATAIARGTTASPPVDPVHTHRSIDL